MHKHTGYVLNADVGMPNGVAELDKDTILGQYQLPTALRANSAEADEDIQVGQPLYLKENGHLGLAFGDNGATSRVVGLATSSATALHACTYTNFGNVLRDDWSAIAQGAVPEAIAGYELAAFSGGRIPPERCLLKVGQIYYLDAIKGQITNIPPESGYLVEIGRAVNSNAIALNIQQSILL